MRNGRGYVSLGPAPGIKNISQAKGRERRKKIKANSGTDSTGEKDSSPTPNQRNTRYHS